MGQEWEENNINFSSYIFNRDRATYSASSQFDFFIPSSIVAIIVNLKNKNIYLKSAFIISIFGILGAIIGANISINMDVKILKKMFGIFLAIIAIHEIYTIVKSYKKA